MGKFSFQSRVRYSECGEDCRLTLGGVVNYFQDAATFQGEELGIGIRYLKERKLAWILAAWQIYTDHMPRLGETVTAWTWAHEFKGFYGLRNLVLEDESGQAAAWANSTWVLMDMAKKRPAKIPDNLIGLYGTEKRLEMDYSPRRILVPKEGEEMDAFPIQRGHLDSNHHVNNGQYIHMAMDYLPSGFKIYETRVEYRKQAFLGDVIHPFVVKDEGRTLVSLQNDSGDAFAVVQFMEHKESSQKAN